MSVRRTRAHLPVVAEPEEIPVEWEEGRVRPFRRGGLGSAGFEPGPHGVDRSPFRGRNELLASTRRESRALERRGQLQLLGIPGHHDHPTEPQVVEREPVPLRQRLRSLFHRMSMAPTTA